jgi:hypothetical protein
MHDSDTPNGVIATLVSVILDRKLGPICALKITQTQIDQ